VFYFLGIGFYSFSMHYDLNHEFEKLIGVNILSFFNLIFFYDFIVRLQFLYIKKLVL